ncbi:5-methylthioribose kinase [Klebsiella pneumoniae]|nr:5-methylthioribose kinase [Klebsiella pneumoniae]
MVMEDLSDHRIWRGELIANVYYPQAARQLGDYLAQVLFHTSDFYLHPHEKKAQVAQFINPAMCEITEDLFFNDPYQIHERNNYPAELEADVAALRDDAQLKLAVAALKHRFFAHAEALLHGDIHSGVDLRCRRQPEGHRRRVRLLRPHWLRYRHRHRQPAA